MQFISKNFKNKKVIVTGHTGFKGSWLSLWLYLKGAKVLGISKNIPTQPSHFNSIKLQKKLIHKIVDIKDKKNIQKIFKQFKPDFVFHLAAQSLVKKSYTNAVDTWQTNTIGTINILEAIKTLKNNCVGVIITSDKCYKNLEISRGYNENDIIGGIDPYSASKASAELAINSYVKSFFVKKKNIKLAVARAGNVIGGGDWSENRVVPDCIRAWSTSKIFKVRNPNSTRPWQHVLEALSGYLILAIQLKKNDKINGEAFNFGPKSNVEKKVSKLIKEMKLNIGRIKIIKKKNNKFYESQLLKLNSKKAKNLLNWRCILNFRETIKMTALWYKNFYERKVESLQFSKNQILEYEKKLTERH